MRISEYHLGFLGFGSMAQVLFKAIDRAKLISRSQIVFHRRDPDKARKNEQEFGITATSLAHLLKTSDLVILGVRPQQLAPLLKEMADLKEPLKPLISMAAGVQLKSYQERLGEVPLIRVMPNVASAVGEGMSVLAYGPKVPSAMRDVAEQLFSCMGEVMEVSEALMDISCAIAGSGPGFVFRLIEAMAQEGVSQGLSYELGLKMAAQTFAGAARLILKGHLPEALIAEIATPNGTTEAGFRVMDQLDIDGMFKKVVTAAARRSSSLATQSMLSQ